MTIDYINKVKQLVDEIKWICNSAGLGGDANEYKIVTQSFLYKFLNDKFLYEVWKIDENLTSHKNLSALSESELQALLEFKIGTKTAHLKPQHLLTYLFDKQDETDFAKTFDETLNDIAVFNTEVYSVHTDGGSDIRLFEEQLIQRSISDSSKQNWFAKSLINKLANTKFNFEEIFSEWFDFFSTIFEYMIADYNKDGGGKYAEYYTPHAIAKIMAEILVWNDDVSNVKVYDPSAWSGTLLMNIAHKIGTGKASIYSQDVSQKSSNLLRLNLILNGLSHSINNIVQWNTILHNVYNDQKMDYIVSNPPFKMDFSDWSEEVRSAPNVATRFFAGVPNDTANMSIYLLFIQHIMYSLAENWKAAIVVPTGFLTAGSSIEKAIKEKIIDSKMLKWVVSMPSNIFARTEVNVSILFLDKTANDDKIVLVDASNLGEKVKLDGSNQKTVLSPEEEAQIIQAFYQDSPIEDFSVFVSNEEIIEKNYSLSAGQYFPIKIEYVDITAEEFEDKMQNYKNNLSDYFTQSHDLEEQIFNWLEKLKYE